MSGSREAYLMPRGFDCHEREVCNGEFLLRKATEWEWGNAALARIAKWTERERESKPLIGTPALWAPPAIPK